jgi:hypothetical protein
MPLNHEPVDSKVLAREVERRFSLLERQRNPYHALWNEIAEHAGPSFGGFGQSDPTHPIQPEAEQVDTTLRRSADILSSGLLSYLSSPAQRWFRLTTKDRDMADSPEIRGWLQQVEEVYNDTLHRQRFYPVQAHGYHISALFGVKALYVDETPTAGIRFMARPLQELFIAQDYLGRIDTVCRLFKLTARQMVQAFGLAALDKAGAKDLLHDYRMQSDGRGGDSERAYEVLHLCAPMDSLDGLIRRGLPRPRQSVASVYVLRAEKVVLGVGGYEELPYIVDRWQEHPATAYASDWPGLAALADGKMINEMKTLILESGQLATAPPIWAPDDGFVGRLSVEPRAINYYDKSGDNSLADFGAMDVGGDPRLSLDLLSMVKKDIQEAFFTDLFQMLKIRTEDGGDPTATEVRELAQEKMFLLGPMLYRQQEAFDHLFDRLFRLLWRRGEIPPPPRELVEAKGEIEVEYVSPLALAQKESQTQAILRTYQEAGILARFDPQILDNFKNDAVLRRITAQRGFPQDGLRSEEEVARLRQQRQQQMQAQQQAQALAEGAAQYPNLAKAPEEGSPAEQIMKAAGGKR